MSCGFEQVRVLEGPGLEIAMIPLHGHTAGHSGYAIRRDGGWLLHCGDAYLHHEEVGSPSVCSHPRRVYHRLNSHDAAMRRTNAERLSDLARDHGDEITLFCSHDPGDFARLTA